MATAPTYKDLPQTCAPYTVNGKMYVNVLLNNGKEKTVRWYTNPTDKVSTPRSRSYKEVLGFDKGYITLFKGDTYSYLDWFHSVPTRYSSIWGWYLVSTEEMPEDVPADLSTIKLYWTDISRNDNELKPEAEIREWVEALLYPVSGEYVGNVGERLDLMLTVVRALPVENAYGVATLHIMKDADDHTFIWSTAAKTLAEDGVYHIKGKVKDHRMYKGEKQTVLYYCSIAK